MENEYFLTLRDIGDLTLFDVLINYDYPRVFVCEDVFNTKYLFSECESEENYDRWIVQKVSLSRYIQIKTNKISLQKSFINSEEKKYYKVTKNYVNDEVDFEILNELPANSITNYESYLGESLDSVEDIHNIIEKSRKLNSSIVDISLYPNQDIDDIELPIFSGLCDAFKTMFNDFYGKKRAEQLRISTVKGSFVIRFNMNDKINLFNEGSSNYAIDKINDLLNSDTVDDLFEIFQHNPKALKSYTNFVHVLKKSNTSVQIATASPNKTIPNVKNLSVYETKKKYDLLKKIYDEQTRNIIVTGTLTALNIKKKMFTFTDSDGNEYSGQIEKEYIQNKKFVIPGEYQAKIKEKTIVDKRLVTKKSTYMLMSLKKI